MHLYHLVLCLIITLFCSSTTSAKDLMDPVVVTATKVKTQDTKTTYASEVYSREDIEKSGAVTIYDFFQQNTSAAIMPSYGNTFNQMIDIRGFGLTDGYKNIAITVNGRRLNNIDSVGQQLSDIPINNIEITTGTKVFDWEIPNEWNINDAYIKTPNGEKIVDFKKNNLHVLGYSEPFEGKIKLEELRPGAGDYATLHAKYTRWNFRSLLQELEAGRQGELL